LFVRLVFRFLERNALFEAISDKDGDKKLSLLRLVRFNAMSRPRFFRYGIDS